MKNSTPLNKKTFSLRWILIVALLILLIVLFLIGGIPQFLNAQKVKALSKESPLPKVTVLKVEPNKKPVELILPSSAQAWHFTPIWSRVNGYLVRYLVDIGDVVKEGDLLAEIDTPETDEQLAQAQADLLNAKAERDIAKITSDRWQTLWNKNQEAVSKQEVDQYNANLKSAEAVVLVNEKNVARYTYLQQFKYIYAPFDGVITQRLVDIGSLVYGSINGTTQELFQIAKTDIIRFYVYIPQTYYRQVKEGLETEVSITQLQGKVFKGVVSRFAKALDPIARTLQTEIDVENKERLLYSGLYGQVKFMMKPSKDSFIIPTTALIIRSSTPHVATVDINNTVLLQPVKIGLDYGNEVEIINGLKTDDRIIVIPSSLIQNGDKVEIISPPSQEGQKNI